MSQSPRRLFTRLMVYLVAAIVMVPTAAAAQLLVSSEGTNEVLSFNVATGASLGAFVTAGSGGLSFSEGVAFGPDGSLYVSSFSSRQVLRYDGQTGAFVDVFVESSSGGLFAPLGLVFGPDGNLYVNSGGSRILRYNGGTGSFLGVFVEQGSGGLYSANSIVFGPDGRLYVGNSTLGGAASQILRYNGQTGAFLDTFVTSGSGGLKSPLGLAFGPDGNLLVSSQQTHQVLRYSGQTGAFLNAFVPAGSGGLKDPTSLVFGTGGDLFVSSYGTGKVLRYNGSTGAFVGVAASDVFSRFIVFRTVECQPTTLSAYMDGVPLTVNLHMAHSQPFALPIEMKLWLDVPGVGSVGLINVGADGTVILPSGFDQTVPISLGTVGPSYPRGSYQIGCRILNPVTGSRLSEAVGKFTIQ